MHRMSSSDQSRKTANAIGGKTARACDSCLSKRARWFCVADDAFLCQSCDVSVHSANQLASRHQRVRLGTTTSSSMSFFSSKKCDEVSDDSTPAWLHGFTRKPRTPRNNNKRCTNHKKHNLGGGDGNNVGPMPSLVPEMGFSDDDNNNNDNDNQLFCQVPVLLDEDLNALLNDNLNYDDNEDDVVRGLEIPEFLSPDVELAEFAADVESLLGAGDNTNTNNDYDDDNNDMKRTVKIEIRDHRTEALDWNFGDDDEVEQKLTMMSSDSSSSKEEVKKTMFLTLNYEEVISAWASQGCPWTDGTRPDIESNHYWRHIMGEWYGGDHHHHHHHHPYGGAFRRRSDEGREARVTRYREKRRTRLFSKKIRYEVRKLNAEKRPRLKGRFVKRTSFQTSSPPSFPNYLVNHHYL